VLPPLLVVLPVGGFAVVVVLDSKEKAQGDQGIPCPPAVLVTFTVIVRAVWLTAIIGPTMKSLESCVQVI